MFRVSTFRVSCFPLFVFRVFHFSCFHFSTFRVSAFHGFHESGDSRGPDPSDLQIWLIWGSFPGYPFIVVAFTGFQPLIYTYSVFYVIYVFYVINDLPVLLDRRGTPFRTGITCFTCFTLFTFSCYLVFTRGTGYWPLLVNYGVLFGHHLCNRG